MNKIVREHFPAERLPPELREGLAADARVTVTVETETTPTKPESADGWFTRHQHVRRDNYKTSQEIDEWIRTLRDEWSHRER